MIPALYPSNISPGTYPMYSLLLEVVEVLLASLTELGMSTDPLLAQDIRLDTSVEGSAPAVIATLALRPWEWEC